MREELRLGVDVGSTTVKLAVTDKQGNLLYSVYERHYAKQMEKAAELLENLERLYPDTLFRAAVCGSGGKPVSEAMGVPFIQEVVANAAAVCALYPSVRTAIELGGQDAKIIFFYYDEHDKKLKTSDMRMNGSCAGGTGAFIDEIAKLLDTDGDGFELLAEKGSKVFDISGRCGVFAKTDIQPLLIQGAAREDIALSTFHSIAKQTIGGLAQGLELKAPIIFEGGPLTFNPTLIKVFSQRLNLKEDEVIIPEHPETIVALGASYAIDQLYPERKEGDTFLLSDLSSRLRERLASGGGDNPSGKPFFSSAEEKEAFLERHKSELLPLSTPVAIGGKCRAYLGIDSGSTTTKMVLLDEDENVIDRFYANNGGVSLNVAKEGIKKFYKDFDDFGVELEIIGLGTTGYGENMMAKAFSADYHVVETVAHSTACLKYYPDASFILDIGGQDMKAIWLKDGIVTNIMLNEACSSGCGSFLENFAGTLGIKVEEAAEAAFKAKEPALLGSRCTVFMNSTIITEQRNGRNADDIIAGLCRSIIENVFTKVVRISNTDELGETVVVQGGTFRNMAVLKALEEHLGRKVILAPYPGEMGALGAAILAKRQAEESGYRNNESTSFIGREEVERFGFKTETGVPCAFCANHCSRNIITFTTGDTWVTGNRCERGEVVEDKPREKKQGKKGEDLFLKREEMLFETFEASPGKKRGEIIGLPRTLEFWDSMPFWSTFFRSLGYEVKFSDKSNEKLYESGLGFVASDTICFPAKLVHGHIANLAEKGVDRIFMPYVMHMPPEGTDKLSPYVCSVVQGYPMVVRNSQNPEERYGVKFDTPIFHFFTEKARRRQILEYAVKTLGATKGEAEKAFTEGERALLSFRAKLTKEGERIIEKAKAENAFAVVLAGRPYHSDSFVSHNISKLFTKKGISVIPVDALADLNKTDLSHTRIEITNNFHTRMLSGALLAAKDENLEYVQLVSFGCGHDAVLSDEIVRIVTETSGKSPLILKVDESEASGSLAIRVQSFIETIQIRRKLEDLALGKVRELPEPAPVKIYKNEKKKRTLLIPNISKEVSVLLKAILEKENFIVKTVPVGGREQIRLGKKYVHNDICFPCQMVIGELISELQTGNYNQDEVVVGMVKFQCDCRMSHYSGLLRKGLDSSGFKNVPVITTDINDTKDMHPNVFLLGLTGLMDAVWVFEMLDLLTEIVRKIRPYEINKGETDKVYEHCVDLLADGIRRSIGAARKAFEVAIDELAKIPYDRSRLKPRVFVTGEILVTYHPGSNFQIERYLESNGMEAVFPRVTDQLRKDFDATMVEINDYNCNQPPWPHAITWLFDSIQKKLEKSASRHPLYEKGESPKTMYQGVKDIIPETLSCGEGWLMAAEIEKYANKGVKSFVILQPFGCLPNHICGRGVIKKLKDLHPDIHILPLDLDPDTSYANVENRLQMLLMNDRGGEVSDEPDNRPRPRL